MTGRRLVASLALAAFLCAAALAVADVVRIGPPWTVKTDPETFVRADKPAEQLSPPSVEEEPDLPAAPPADEPKSCVGDATCVKPARRGDRGNGKLRERDRNRDRRAGGDEQDRADADDGEGPRDALADPLVAEPVAGAIEVLADLDEEALTEDALTEDALTAPGALWFGARLDDGVATLPACASDDSCAALLEELFGCDSLEACEQLYFGAIAPAEDLPDLDGVVDPVLEAAPGDLEVVGEPAPL